MEKFRSTASASNPFAAQLEPETEETPNILDLFGNNSRLNKKSHILAMRSAYLKDVVKTMEYINHNQN